MRGGGAAVAVDVACAAVPAAAVVAGVKAGEVVAALREAEDVVKADREAAVARGSLRESLAILGRKFSLAHFLHHLCHKK